MPPKSSSPYKVGVIGTINRDTIYYPDGGIVNSWGGILYSLKYLCQTKNIQVCPAVNVGYDCFDDIMRLLKQFPRLDLSLVNRVASKNNHCLLRYVNQSDKSEIIKGGVPPLRYEQVKPLLDSNLILVNFISGRDISLQALERLRKEYNGIIYIDLHSLTLGRRKTKGGFARFLRRPRNWQRYVACADILQVNRVEFELISGTPFSIESAYMFFSRCRGEGLRYLIITLGQKGCLIVHVSKRIHSISIPASRPATHPYDTTGCGDVFAAGFISTYSECWLSEEKNLIKAAQTGNCLAAQRCMVKGRLF